MPDWISPLRAIITCSTHPDMIRIVEEVVGVVDAWKERRVVQTCGDFEAVNFKVFSLKRYQVVPECMRS
jgi:hypothetical protein